MKLLSGSLPTGMNLYWSKDELYFRGTPTVLGARTAVYQLTSGGSSYTLQVEIAVVKSTNTEKTYSYMFTSGEAFSKNVNPASDYFSCTRVSGELPPFMTAKLTDGGLHIETENYPYSYSGAYPIMAGLYTSIYDVVTGNGARYRCTVNILVKPQGTSTLSDMTVTMAKGLKGIISLSSSGYFRIEVASGSLPDGVRMAYSYDRGLCIVGTPTASGTYTADLQLYTCQGYCHKLNLTVNVNEPSATDCTVNLYGISGGKLSDETRKGNSTYTLPGYTGTLPDGIRFTGWWYDGKTYKAGDAITVNALTADIYALCDKTETVKSIALTIPSTDTGEQMKWSASAPSVAEYEVDSSSSGFKANGVMWYIDNAVVTPGKVRYFEGGVTYKVVVFVKIKNSIVYSFGAAENLIATVNGEKAEVARTSDSKCTVSYTFTVSTVTQINQINITVPEPKAGEHPSYDVAVPAGAGYSVYADLDNDLYTNGARWARLIDGSQYILSSKSVFENGGQYKLTVILKPSDDEREFAQSVSGTVNGQPADVKITLDNSEDRFITYIFDIPESSGVILGDVDGDNVVTIIDATAIQRHLAGIATKAYIESAADADGDGSVSILDATAIQRHLAGLPTNENIAQPIA